jgi:hypothetical protein
MTMNPVPAIVPLLSVTKNNFLMDSLADQRRNAQPMASHHHIAGVVQMTAGKFA